MQKTLLLLLLSVTIHTSAQDLKFDKKFVQSEDNWVAFKPDSIGSYNFGFIYIDAQAGLTLDYAGSFTIDKNGVFLPKAKEIEGAMKYRLEPNNVLVAHIPESKMSQLKVSLIPDFLAGYKVGENTVERLYKWGYMYNGWGECNKALEFLEKAAKLNTNYKGLAVELAYSYNCLEQYQNAITVLKTALKSNPKDSYTNKEYIFALAKNNQLDEAKKIYKKSLETSSDKTYQVENAFNILQGYFLKKDNIEFQNWLTETKDLYSSNSHINGIVEKMKTQIKN